MKLLKRAVVEDWGYRNGFFDLPDELIGKKITG